MKSARIMIVEDDRVTAFYLKELLEGLGYEVVASLSSGFEATQKAVELSPDLVLMDIGLKGSIDGIDAAKWISSTCEIPMIYLTAYSDNNTLERAKFTGHYGYVLKPVDEKSLESKIEIVLHKSDMNRRAEQYTENLFTILENMSEGVIVSDINGEVYFINSESEQLTGYSSDEVLGKYFGEIFKLHDAETKEVVILPISEVIEKEESVRLEGCALVTKEKSEVTVDINLRPLRCKGGDINDIVLIFHETAS